ncbi:capsule assembly Wzi family protein [Dyadobacter sp. CY356]|nr:capsule assembly Wzi family protein [Dyadobacter sp. CY356]
MREYIFLFCISILSSFANAQDSTLTYSTAISLAASTAQTPFWLRANQNGVVPGNGTFGLGQFGLYKNYNTNNPRIFQWSAGAELIANFGKSGYGRRSDYFFTDLYAAGKIGPVEILVGQKKHVTGLMDTTLTSGSLSFSGNARPIPGFQISIPSFYPLAFTNYFISVKASFGDGRLGPSNISYGSVPSVPSTYFHEKSLYFRFGKPSDRIKIFAGINHQARWGGESEISPVSKLNTINAYWYVISGKTFDYRKIGSHFGTIDIAGEWTAKAWTYLLYRQNIYETGSLFKVTNFADGLNGIRIRRNKPLMKDQTYFDVNSFLFEVVGTKNQTNNSPLSGLALFDKGDYYNSYIYSQGLSFKGGEIGTALNPNQDLTDKVLPRNSTKFTNNNRIWAFHSGVKASWLNTDLQFRGTYSRNFGTYINPFNSAVQQFSMQLSASKKMKFLRNGSFIASFYSDIGSLYPSSSSFVLGYRKIGFL